MSLLQDPLTGLPNRALFNDRLERGLVQAQQHGWRLALMFVDLDDFKTINDTFGHGAGDSVLQTMGERLKANTRDGDTVSRYGGDEFLYLLMQIRDEQDISLIAEKVIKSIQMPCNVNVGDVVFTPKITASVGISIFPSDGTTAETLLKSAENAMNYAKRNNTGCSFFNRIAL
jgi:diguanylate cyclase (GGDEF)-like protein